MPGVTITCRTARMDPATGVPTMPLTLGGSSLGTIFSAGSGGDIQLNVVQSPHLSLGNAGVEDFDLHSALSTVTGNPTNVTKVSTIGMLFADSYAPRPSAFGFMFDRGFSFDPGLSGAVPREGCAIFVGAIQRARPATFDDETAFTAIHELGHVFNLFHVEQPANLMATSPNSLASAASKGFLPRHRTLLGLCSTRAEVHPGGNEFGDLGTLDTGPIDPFRDIPAAASAPLRLSISTAREEFWHFEPVELDLTLSVRRGVTSAVEVPDTLDPGYENFRIWISDPNGERRLYRSTKHFCGAPGALRVAPGAPFRRDIGIFGQSGGYTFTRAGEHRVRVEFFVPGIGTLRSNVLAVNVLPITQRDRLVSRAMPVLERADVARLLFYRKARRRTKAFDDLEELARSMKSAALSADLHYTLGRAALKALPHSRADAQLNKAAGHLSRAAERHELSPHRREVAARLLNEIR